MIIEAGRKPEEATIRDPDEAKAYSDIIGCRYVTVVARKIKGKAYCMTADDEGLLNDCPIASVVGGGPALYGKVIVTGPADGWGRMTKLGILDAAAIAGRVLGNGILVCDPSEAEKKAP